MSLRDITPAPPQSKVGLDVMRRLAESQALAAKEVIQHASQSCQSPVTGCFMWPSVRPKDPEKLARLAYFETAGAAIVAIPAAPENLDATQPAPETTVSWTDVATNETGYELRWRNITQGGGFITEDLLPPDSVGTVVIIVGAQDTDQVEIQVRAIGSGGASEWVSITVTASIQN